MTFRDLGSNKPADISAREVIKAPHADGVQEGTTETLKLTMCTSGYDFLMSET